MSWTKRQLAEEAFAELALAGYTFDLTPEEIMTAIRRMDSMMATWGATAGIRVGYNATVDPLSSDPDQESGIPDWCNEAVYLNLAIRLCGAFGKPLPRTTAATAREAYDSVLSLCSSRIPEMQPMANTPAGAGWKYGRRGYGPFLRPPVDRLTTGEDGLLEFNGTTPV